MVYPSIENLTKTNNLGAVLAIIGPKHPLTILSPPASHITTRPPWRQKKKQQGFVDGLVAYKTFI
jgi:hypothetical protein